jgi:hypothetical protein
MTAGPTGQRMTVSVRLAESGLRPITDCPLWTICAETVVTWARRGAY